MRTFGSMLRLNKKEMFVKQITLICICAVLSVVVTACPRGEAKPQTQTLSETSAAITADSYVSNEPYAKIISGDLSDFAGTWVNIHGERRQLYADGIFGSPGTISNITKNDEGTSDAYKWYVLEGINEPIPGEYGYFVYLYPAGAALDIEGINIINGYHIRGILANDSTKDRIILRPRPQHDALQPDYFVFYREGEAPNAETLFAQALPELVQAQTKAALGEYKNILNYESSFYEDYYSPVYINDLNIRQFALVDMDGDNIPELVLHDTSNGDTFVLQFNGSNGAVYGKKYSYRAMKNLKKDGTFDWSNSAFDSGTGRLHLSGPYQRMIIIADLQDSKEDVIWHELTNENDFVMDINGTGTIIIYTGSDKSVIIPARIGDVPVTAIGDNAFISRDIESISLPDSIIEIERTAFSGNKLKSITIPNNVIYIGLQAFTGNPLTSITIGNNVELTGGTYTSFPNGFDEYYNDNGKKAGTYVYNNGQWSLR